MISPERLQDLLIAFSEEAKLFFYQYGLAHLVLDVSVDHIAIKALDRKTYEAYLEMYKPLCERLSFEPVSSRDIATAELSQPLDAATFGTVALLEIMEPKPDSIATTHDLIDHIELLVPNLEIIQTALTDKEVVFKVQKNKNHTAVVIPITEWDQEVKFTTRSLSDIASQQIVLGAAKII